METKNLPTRSLMLSNRSQKVSGLRRNLFSKRETKSVADVQVPKLHSKASDVVRDHCTKETDSFPVYISGVRARTGEKDGFELLVRVNISCNSLSKAVCSVMIRRYGCSHSLRQAQYDSQSA